MRLIAENEKMGIDTCNTSVSIPRPTTLVLDNSWNSLDNNNNMMMPETNSEVNKNGMAVNKRRKKKRAADAGVKKFEELYEPTGETLGQGSFGAVSTYRNLLTSREYAVKVILKTEGRCRHKVLKEIEIFHHCKGQDNILQLVEFFEQEDRFYLVFEKMEGGSLLETIERRGHLTEQEASLVIRDIAKALHFLHKKGIAHRDLKPENILCCKAGQLVPVKLCDFDLGSGVVTGGSGGGGSSGRCSPATTPELLTPVGSAEFMAPEVVDVWVEQGWSYDKRCDLWSLGIITYIMLCGYPPFYGQCGRDCGWENGGSCQTCQESLFTRIQEGTYTFPEEEWSCISDQAKDLIRHLLVRDPMLRYTAAEVLHHEWVSMESSCAQLATPQVLQRNNSVNGLEAFAESANAFNRLILRHLSISEACEPASQHLHRLQQNHHDQSLPVITCMSLEKEKSKYFTDEHSQHEAGDSHMFFIGDVQEESDEEHQDQPPVLWMGLTPPGESVLARRRKAKLSAGDSIDGSSSGEGGSQDEADLQIGDGHKSPHKVPSAMF